MNKSILTIFQYFDGNSWIEEFWHIINKRTDFKKLMIREISIDTIFQISIDTIFQKKTEIYHLDNLMHRLDGPAFCVFHKTHFTEKEITTEWYAIKSVWSVFGTLLPKFDASLLSKNGILGYVKDYPDYIKQIEVLCLHHKIFQESDLLLLSSMSLFYG